MEKVKYVPIETEKVSLYELRSMLEGVIDHIEGRTINLDQFNERMGRSNSRERRTGSRKNASR